MEQQDIIFIDRNSKRKYAMIEAFRPLCVRLFFLDFNGKCIMEEEKSAGNFIKSSKRAFDLIFIHPRDQNHGLEMDYKHRIWYGGYGSDDVDIPPDEARITRPIIDSSSTLSREEAQAFYDYFFGSSTLRPSVLSDPKYDNALIVVTDFFEILKDPMAVDWSTITLPAEMNRGQREWTTFKAVAMQLIRDQPGGLSAFDQRYLDVLDEFINHFVQ